jgi:hypothetical protein
MRAAPAKFAATFDGFPCDFDYLHDGEETSDHAASLRDRSVI